MKHHSESPDPASGLRFRLAHSQSKLAHLNQAELGKYFHVSQQTISNWMNGVRIPMPVQCREICEAFGVNVEWLYTGRGERHPNPDPMLRRAHQLMELDWKVKESLNLILMGVEKDLFTIEELRAFVELKMTKANILPF